MTACLIEHFSPLNDPRIDRKKLHKLIDIIVLSVSAMASGADGWEAIEEFGKEKLDWLRKFVPLENGVQSGSYLGEDDIVRFEDVYGRESDGEE